MKIAVLLATYNRLQKTRACLLRLTMQRLPAGASMEIFLTDDASSDGTADMVKAEFPAVHLFKGSGKLFWAGGMRYTWKKAMYHSPDFFLLLNDDTLIYENAISDLLRLAAENANNILAGSTKDAISGQLSYGGWHLNSKKIWSSKRVFSDSESYIIDFANANILLVPNEVVRKIGILSDRFTHSLADYDYCLTAKKKGIQVKLAPGFLGTCSDDHGNNWKSQRSSFRQRLDYLKSPKGLAYHEFMYFIGKHFPLSYPSAFIKLWLKTIFPIIWESFK